MLNAGGTVHLSASDLVGHLNCRYLTSLDLAVANGTFAPFAGLLSVSVAVVSAIKAAMNTMSVLEAVARQAPHLLHAAMRRALEMMSGFELDVRLVSYGTPSRAILQMAEHFD